MEYANELKSRNQMSATSLIKSQNSVISLIENPHNGKIFFTCGSVTGYVKKKTANRMLAGELDVPDLKYAECSVDEGETWIPCLFAPATQNVKATFGSGLLQS